MPDYDHNISYGVKMFELESRMRGFVVLLDGVTAMRGFVFWQRRQLRSFISNNRETNSSVNIKLHVTHL